MAEQQKVRFPVEAVEGLTFSGLTARDLTLSKTNIEVLDLISEGQIDGLVTGEYIYSGNIGETGYASATFYPYSGAPLSTGIRYLRSIYWNEIPVVNSQNQYNFQRIDISFTPGVADGSLLDQTNPELTISRPIGERLKGTTLNAIGTPAATASDFIKYYTIYNKQCKGVIINVRVNQFSETVREGDRAGDILHTQVDYEIYYRPLFSTPNKNVTTYILGKKEKLFGKINYGYVHSSRIDFSASFDKTDIDIKDMAGFLGWEIKIVRTTPDSTTSAVRNQTFIDSITEIYSNAFSYPNSAIVRSNFEAEFFQQVPERAFDCKLLKVKIPSNYDPILKKYKEGTADYPNGWDGTFISGVWTDNPAWCYYDLLTNKRYGLGKYVDSITVDKWTLYEIGKYCDKMVADGYGNVEPLFTCNVIINSRDEAFKVLNDMASIFRAISYYGAGGQIYAVQDAPKTVRMAFNNSNIENGNFSYQSSSKKIRHTVAIVRYNDRTQFYKPAIEYVEDIDGIRKFGIRELELTAFGCTSRGQATRLGRWALLSESLETETVSFTAGLDATILMPGDVFTVFDSNRKTKRHAGRTFRIEHPHISSGYVTLDSQISLDTGTMYTFNLATPGYYYDVNTVTNLTSTDFSGIGRTMIQKRNFTGIQATGLYDGKTQIKFSESFSTGDYLVTGNLIWYLELASGVSTYNETQGFVNPSFDYYRALKISEKEGFKYEVVGLQYNENKYKQIESGLNYERTREVYRITPQAPDFLALNVYSPSPNTKLIYYSFIVNNYSGITSYRVFAKDKDFPTPNGGVPDTSYLIANLPVGVTNESFLPSQTGNYYFRVYSYNDDAGIYSAGAASGNIEIKGINPIRDVTISSLTFENVSGDNAAGNRITGEYFNSSPMFKWNIGIKEDSFIPSDFKYRISIREPSATNVPSTTIYYQNTGYVPNNVLQPNYQFDIETNAASVGGPYRTYDIVVEAIDATGYTSAGNFVGVPTVDNNWSNFPLGYDIFGVTNIKPSGFNLSTGVGHPQRPPWEKYNTRQLITPDGGVIIRWSGDFSDDLVGAFVFSSTGNFSGNDVIYNTPRPDIKTTHADWDLRSKTMTARCGLLGYNTGYIGVAFYDIFDDYFIQQKKWGNNIGSGLSGCYNVSPVFPSGNLLKLGIGIEGTQNQQLRIESRPVVGAPGIVEFGFYGGEELGVETFTSLHSKEYHPNRTNPDDNFGPGQPP